MQYYTKTQVDQMLDAAMTHVEGLQTYAEKLASELETTKAELAETKKASTSRITLEKIACSDEATNTFVSTLADTCLINPEDRMKYANAIKSDPNAALILASQAIKRSTDAGVSQGRGVTAKKQAAQDSIVPEEQDEALRSLISK